MNVLNKIAHFQNRRDEVPNQELAEELARERNIAGVKEIAENLWNKDKKIQSDCLKVLYEIGYRKPELIVDYVDDFIKLLLNKNNRLVWGSMIALSTIATIKAKEIFEHFEQIKKAIEQGSVITVDGGIKTLAGVASAKGDYREKLFPYLINKLKFCRPKSVPMYAEFILVAVDSTNKDEFIAVLNKRKDILTTSQLKRIDKIIKILTG